MFLAMILMGVLVVSINVHRVEAQLLTVYIKANGDVDPSWVPIQRNGDVYTFTGDIMVDGDATGMIIERDNMTLDGANNHFSRSPLLVYAIGIELTGRHNVTITNLVISDFSDGIFLNSTSQVTIRHNTIQYQSDGEGVRVYFSSNVTISENEINNNLSGIHIWASSDNEIIGNNLTANNGGIALGGDNNTLYRNNVQAKYIGIDIFGSYNIISGNNITNCDTGFFFGMDTVYDTVSGNNIENNNYSLYFEQALNHSIIGNNIANNKKYGVLLDWYSFNMRIYHNAFVNNTNHMDVSNPANLNFLDNGIEGNYWSNYTGVDSNHDGIGDTNHTINANNVDMYPLMGPFHNFNTSAGEYVSVVSNSTVTYFNYAETKGWITIQVRNATTEQTFGFCRVSIPHNLIDPEVTWINVVIDDGTVTPLFFNNTLYDNGTHRWIYVAYPHPYSLHEIVIIPEFPSFLILPLFMMATLLAVMIYKRKHSNKVHTQVNHVQVFESCSFVP